MSLLQSMKGLANKIGLIKIVSVPDAAQPEKIVTRTITLRELIAEIKSGEVKALADSSTEFTTDFDKIFKAAGLKTPAHGWDLAKLQDFLGTGAINQNLSEETQHTVLAMLATQKVPVEDIVKDAMARDKAIDAYAMALHAKRQTRRAAQANEKAETQAQIASLQTKLRAIDAEISDDDQRWQQWWQRKLACENQMAAAINVLLKDQVITIDAQLPPDQN